MKDKFFLTFGQRYKREHHPSGYNINPNGWIEVYAYNYDLARQKAFDVFGSDWCWLYSEQGFNQNDFPSGKLASIE